MEPERFAADLIIRLEGVLREREAEEKLEERLKRVRLVCSFLVSASASAVQNITGSSVLLMLNTAV